ncbi:MAG TPA: hypothetical protein PK812_03830 [Beijerinckiaceae bacterium]|nr:hypothetical protein [Beijerinckiaceae bacterium]
MTIRFAPKILTAAAVLGAALFAAAPASAQYYGYHGPRVAAPPPTVYHGPHYGVHPHHRPWKRWAWRHHHRPPPPWAYGPPRYGYQW